MDVPLPVEERERIEELLQRPGVLGWHHLRTRRAGPTRFVELHLELPEEITLREAHALAHQVQDDIRAAFPGTEALVHLDVTRDDE
jgi:ferrous-iron efflux pump FieF